MIFQQSPTAYRLEDHLGGFSKDLTNLIIDSLPTQIVDVKTEYVLSDEIKQKYPHINFSFDHNAKRHLLSKLSNYNIHPELNYKNFICSFNGAPHVSRKLLVSILERFKWFSSAYSSKNFSYSTDIIDGHISDLVGDNELFYRKFFIADNSEDFFQTEYSFGHDRFDHGRNIYKLENKLTQSFLHIVSETLATSYYPFVTEKFLYSIVTQGLFLAYAQPGWHDHVEKYYGFKKYTKLFDYGFDSIHNPVERLVELMSMISKFSILTPHEWHDLYLIERDTIEYNHNHYLSGNYLTMLHRVSS